MPVVAGVVSALPLPPEETLVEPPPPHALSTLASSKIGISLGIHCNLMASLLFQVDQEK